MVSTLGSSFVDGLDKMFLVKIHTYLARAAFLNTYSHQCRRRRCQMCSLSHVGLLLSWIFLLGGVRNFLIWKEFVEPRCGLLLS